MVKPSVMWPNIPDGQKLPWDDISHGNVEIAAEKERLRIGKEWADKAVAHHTDMQMPKVEGIKHDAGKNPWDLLPWDAVRCIVKILLHGSIKYDARNWENGMDWSRPFRACIDHLQFWWQGETKDPESGYSHLWHAGCNILFLIAYELRGKGKDNRPNSP